MRRNPDSLMTVASQVPLAKPAPTQNLEVLEKLRTAEKRAKHAGGVVKLKLQIKNKKRSS